MNTYKEYAEALLLEKDMSLEMARTIFGNNIPDNPDALKKKWKQLAKDNHPDHGGSLDAMKDINAAYLVLKNNPISRFKAVTVKDKENSWKDAIIVQKLIVAEIKAKIPEFLKYFSMFESTVDDYSLDYNDIEAEFEKHKKRKLLYSFSRGVSYSAKFFNNAKTTVFTLSIHVPSHTISLGSLGSSNVAPEFEVMANNLLYHNKRQHKMKRRSWSFGSSGNLTDPKFLFPKKELTKVFFGKKQGKFTKKDMLLGLKVIGGTENRNGIHIPIHDDSSITIDRTTLQRKGFYNIDAIVKQIPKKGSKQLIKTFSTPYRTSSSDIPKLEKSIYFPETPEVLDFFLELIKELKRKTELPELIYILNKHLKEYDRKN